MVDVNARMKSLLLSWIPKMVNDNKPPWKYLCLFWTHKLGSLPFCLQCNCSIKDMSVLCKKHKIPLFYSGLLSAWAELHHRNMFNVTDIQKEIIWYNSNINIDCFIIKTDIKKVYSQYHSCLKMAPGKIPSTLRRC